MDLRGDGTGSLEASNNRGGTMIKKYLKQKERFRQANDKVNLISLILAAPVTFTMAIGMSKLVLLLFPISNILY